MPKKKGHPKSFTEALHKEIKKALKSKKSDKSQTTHGPQEEKGHPNNNEQNSVSQQKPGFNEKAMHRRLQTRRSSKKR